jgi:hypothetical protein
MLRKYVLLSLIALNNNLLFTMAGAGSGGPRSEADSCLGEGEITFEFFKFLHSKSNHTYMPHPYTDSGILVAKPARDVRAGCFFVTPIGTFYSFEDLSNCVELALSNKPFDASGLELGNTPFAVEYQELVVFKRYITLRLSLPETWKAESLSLGNKYRLRIYQKFL